MRMVSTLLALAAMIFLTSYDERLSAAQPPAPDARQIYAQGSVSLLERNIDGAWEVPGHNWEGVDGVLVRNRSGGDAWFRGYRLPGRFDLSFEYQANAGVTGGLAYLKEGQIFAIGATATGMPTGCRAAPVTPDIWHKAHILAMDDRVEQWVDGVRLCRVAAATAVSGDTSLFFPRLLDGSGVLKFRALRADPVPVPGQFNIALLEAVPGRNRLADQARAYVKLLQARDMRAPLYQGTGYPAPLRASKGTLSLTRLGQDADGSYLRYSAPALQGVDATGIIAVPRKVRGPMPLIFAIHGTAGSPEMALQPLMSYHDMIRGPLRDGWLVIAPQLLTFNRREQPFGYKETADSIGAIETALLAEGSNVYAFDTARMVATLDLVLKQWDIDPNHIAATGLSHGGFMATYLTAVEPRIRAGSQIGGFSPFVTPGLVPAPTDLLRKIAPRPFLLMAGVHDPFKFVNADWMQEYEPYVRSFYGTEGRLELLPDISGHEYNWSLSKAFFAEALPPIATPKP